MATRTRSLPELLGGSEWKMSLGERAALEGMLSLLEPSVSVEIGTLEGGSLERVSTHSELVHSFDLARHPSVTTERFPNVEFHEGDSHELLPAALSELAAAGTNIDFALVDGDHTAEGARRDVQDLLDSPATGRAVILIHDTLNERVRAGLEQVDFDREKVTFVELDFVVGQLWHGGSFDHALWGGLGLVVTGWELQRSAPGHANRPHDAAEVYETFRRTLAAGAVERPQYGEIRSLERQVLDTQASMRLMERSVSWRLTTPLRRLKRLFR